MAIISKKPVTSVERNFGDDDDQSRVITAEVGGVRLVGVYAPNGQSVDSPAYQYKLAWYGKLQRWLSAKFKGGLPMVVCGDFNVAPEAIDTWDAAQWAGQTLFTPRERAALAQMASANGLVDLFRVKHPDENGQFSWWDYRAGAFRKNLGLRIDHLMVSESLVARCTAVEIDREARKAEGPSDHAPVWADFGDRLL